MNRDASAAAGPANASRITAMAVKLRARPATAANLVAGFAATLVVNLPGQLSYDSVMQLLQGRTGHYNSWHPPVMAWLLGLFDALLSGPALFVTFQAALLFGALLSLLWLRPRTSWLAAPIALFCILTPQLILYQGIVWKDVLFANAGVAGFVVLAWAFAYWQKPRTRGALLVLGFLLLMLAAMTRQNGIILLFFGAIALGMTAWRFQGRKAAILYGTVAFCAALFLGVGGSVALAARGDGGDGARAELVMLQIYDVVGMLHAEPALPLKDIHARDPKLEKAMRGDGVRLYTPVRNDTLSASTALENAIDAAPSALIFAQWGQMIAHHPLTYLRMRARLFAWVFFTPDLVACRPIYTGVDGAPAALKALGLTAHRRPSDLALSTYAAHFEGTPVFSHPAFALAGLVALYLLLRRRRPADIAMAMLMAAAFCFAASFFFISVACDYRYLYGLDLAGLTTLLYLAKDFSGLGRRRDALPGTH
jgi:hypothetical protein